MTWPALSYDAVRPTADTLQLWTQIMGKVALARTPWLNHSWHVTLRLSARGLATPLIPTLDGGLQLELDLIDHQLALRTTDGGERRLPLAAQTVADFYAEVMAALASLGSTTRRRRTTSGAEWCRSSGCSAASARGSWASRARSTSSGAPPTWR